MGVRSDLGGDSGSELRDGDDVVEVVYLHHRRQRSARRLEELEGPVPGLLYARRVRLHRRRTPQPNCRRHFSEISQLTN